MKEYVWLWPWIIMVMVTLTYVAFRTRNKIGAFASTAAGLIGLVMSFILPPEGVSWTFLIPSWGIATLFAWCWPRPANRQFEKSGARQ